jgi:hypothetical protein
MRHELPTPNEKDARPVCHYIYTPPFHCYHQHLSYAAMHLMAGPGIDVGLREKEKGRVLEHAHYGFRNMEGLTTSFGGFLSCFTF